MGRAGDIINGHRPGTWPMLLSGDIGAGRMHDGDGIPVCLGAWIEWICGGFQAGRYHNMMSSAHRLASEILGRDGDLLSQLNDRMTPDQRVDVWRRLGQLERHRRGRQKVAAISKASK